jgi:hypothetical protein
LRGVKQPGSIVAAVSDLLFFRFHPSDHPG